MFVGQIYSFRQNYFSLQIKTISMLKTIALLTLSNVFMTFAWYGHLRFKELPLGKAILISWGIAFLEYCLMVPANRIGYTNGMNGFQLKITQEVITLIVFTVFAVFYLKEPFHWKYLVSFVLLLGAVYFMFSKK
jgi:uncharacterized protein